MKKKKIIIASIIIFSILIFSTAAYAVYQAIYRKYPVSIQTTNVSFIYNGKTYLSEIGTDKIDLKKGVPTDLEMTVEALGSEKLIIDYEITFQVTETDLSDNVQKEQLLSNVIDVYYFNGNRYEYVDKLANISNITNNPFQGKLISNDKHNIKLRLLYSNETFDDYDKKALERKVTITTDASAAISTSQTNYKFVGSEQELKSALTSNTSSLIYLTSDIELTSDITTDYKHGIDFNGHTLTLNGNIIFNYNKQESDSDTFKDNLYIGSSKKSIIKGEGKFVINSNDIILTDNDFLDKITYGSIDISDSLRQILKSRMNNLKEAKEYGTGEELSLLDGLWGYSSLIDTFNSDVLKIDKSNKIIKINDSISATDSYSYYLTINGVRVSCQLLIKGNSIEAIFEKIKDNIKGYRVSSTINLKAYDNSTGAHIDYLIDDKNNGSILNSRGIYQKDGIGFLTNMKKLNVIRPTINLKISKGNETKNFTLSGEDSFILFPLSNEQISSLLVSNTPLTFVSDDTSMEYDEILTSFKEKLSSVSVLSISLTDTKYKDYLNKDTNNRISFVGLASNVIYDTSFIAKINVTISENYEIELGVTINVTLLGKESYVTKYDIKNRLSSKFNENDYINGTSYTFNAYGALAPTVGGNKKIIYIKYNISDEAKEYVSITYSYITNSQIESQVAYFIKNGEVYKFIDIDETEYKIASLDGKSILFAKITDPDFSGIKYQISSDTATINTSGEYAIAYSYACIVNILSNKVPQDEVTNVNVKAELYEIIDFTGDIYNDLTYSYSFPVEGIIHYGTEEGNIKNILFYNALIDCFDSNADKMITYSEAHASFDKVKENLEKKGLLSKYIGKDTTYNLEYLRFDSIKIDYLDGIENFSNISGISLNSCSFTDLNKLRKLHNLAYLSAINNTITNIEPLNLLDNLIYLNLASNSITSISDIAYLSSLQYINFDSNKIIDFEALGNMTTIKELYLRNMTKNGTEFPNDFSIAYQLTLIMVNCVSDNKYPTIKTGNGTGVVFSPSESGKIAVKVLEQLERINRVSQILYLPTSYIDTDGKTHTISWSTSNYKVISITNETDNYGCQKYTITSPVIDVPMDIIAQVDGESFQRKMRVTVIKFDSNHIYLYSNGAYYDLTVNPDLIPDASFLNAIFTTFNQDSTSDITFTDSKGNNISTNEKYVISKKDYEYAISSEFISSIDWSNYGIESLVGMEYIAPYFSTGSGSAKSLNLEGNSLQSLEKLKLLTEIQELRLGGRQYDFNELLNVEEQDTGTSITTSLKLSKLYVYKCYSLDNDEILNELFKFYYYSETKVSIYLADDSTVWDPYNNLLRKKMSFLPSVVTFSNLGSIDIFNTKGIFTSSSGIGIDFYGITHTFSVSNPKIYTRFANIAWNAYNDFFEINNGQLKYKKLLASNETSYLISTLTYSNSKGIYLSYEYIIQINCEDLSKNIVVVDNSENSILPDGRKEVELSDMFGSKELKETILTNLYNSFTDSNKVASKESLTDTNYAYIDGVYYVSLTRLQSIEFNGTYRFTSMTSNDKNFLYGLRYLPNLKSIYVTMDFNVLDGKDLVNLESISVKWSYVDFSNLTTTLEKLKTLSITSFNGFVINKDIGKFMPNLASLTINGTDNSSRAYEYFDLNHLRYFIYNNKTSINYLYLNKVTYNNGSNPGFSNPQTRVLIDLRNAYKATISTNYVEPSYYIGTPTSNSFSTSTKLQFKLDDSGNVEYVYLDSNTKWSASGAAASNTTIDESASTTFENKLFNNMKYYDLGLKVAGKYWSELDSTKKTTLTKGTTLTFPTKSGKILFGVSDDDTSISKNNYNIDWYMWKMVGNTLTSKQKLNETNGEDLSYSCDEDAYLVLVGILKDKYFFIYQFVIGNGDGIYSQFKNDNLRLWAFVNTEISSSDTLTLNNITMETYISTLMSKSYTWKSSYDSNISISNIDDLSNEAIKNYLSSKLTSRIKTLNLSSTKFLDFSFFEELTNLETINASESSFNFNNLRNFTKLKKLDVSYNLYINPNIIKTLPITIQELQLSGTKCDYTLDTFLNLQEWFNTNPSTSFALNVNYVTQTISKEIVDNFISNLKTYQSKEYDITYQSDPFHALYESGSLSIGTTYNISWSYYKQFQTTIDNQPFISTAGVSVNVLWTQNGTVFSNISVPFKFKGTSSDAKKFASSKNSSGFTIDELNYEIIAYAISKGAFSYDSSSNMFFLNNNVEIYWDESLFKVLTSKNFDNFEIKIENGMYKLYLPKINSKETCFIGLKLEQKYYNLYKIEDFKPTYDTPTDTSFESKSFIDLVENIKFDFDDLNYEYYNENIGENKVYLEVQMPKYIFIGGVAYKISITPEKENYSNLVKNSDTEKSSIILDSEELVNNNNLLEEATKVTIKFQLYIISSDQMVKLGKGTNVISISIYHGQSTDILIDSYDLYVEAENDTKGYYITYGSTLEKKYFTNVIRVNKVSDTRYDLDSNGTTYLVRGSEIFDSGRFQYSLIQKFVNNLLYESSSSTHIIGTVISTSKRLSTTNLSISRSDGQSDAISSIEGIQIFYNLQKFDFTGGIFQSLEPLRSLKLIYFYYRTTDTNTYTMVEDFSPLLEGSADTLKEFQYASRSNTFVNDFSFLLNFNHLKTVYMFSTSVNGCDNKAYKYMNLANFAYLVDSLNNKGVEVVVKKSILGSNPYIETDAVKHSNSDEYTVKVKTEYKEAIRLLGLYETSSVYDLSPTMVNNHMLNISKDSINANGNFVYLPATLNDSGKLYLIDYISESASLYNISYVLKTSTGEEVLSADKAEALIKTSDFYSNQLSKTSVLYVKIEVASKAVQNVLFKNCGYLKLNMRVLVGTGENKYYTERTLTLNFI